MRALIALLLLFWLLPAQAVIETYEFDSPQTEAEYQRLIDELRCLVCQNQNLKDSDAELARDLRRETYDMLQAGKSPEEVIDFMVARYGDFVLYRPQFKTSTWLLWLGPFVLLLIVLVVFVRRMRAASEPAEVDAATLAQARNLLEDKESR